MPLPLFFIGGSLAAAGLGFVFGSRRNAARGAFCFLFMGWTVHVEPEGDAWTWRAAKDGATPGEGTPTTTKIDAADAARAWIVSRQIKGAVEVITDTMDSAGEGTAPTNPRPPAPMPPAGPIVEPPMPSPLGGGFPPKSGSTGLSGGGLYWRKLGNNILLQDLQRFVYASFGASEPYSASPGKVVRAAIQAALPELDMATFGDSMTITLANGNVVSWAESAALVEDLQTQLHTSGNPDVPAFAADILHEGIFDTEQQQSQSPFAFRGRLIRALPAAGGFVAQIRHGEIDYATDIVQPTVADAIQAGIAQIRDKDGV